MRTHYDIVTDEGGYRQLARKLGLPPERVRFWQMRKRIPPSEWLRVSESGAATLEELAAAEASTAAAQDTAA